MRVQFQHFFASAFLLTATVFFTSPAAAGHIDFIRSSDGTNFSLTQNSATQPPPNTQTASNADVLGMTRTATLSRGGIFGGTVNAFKAPSPGGDVISFTASALGQGTLSLAYNGILDANFANLWDGFIIDLPSIRGGNPNAGYGIDVSLAVTEDGVTRTVTQSANNQNRNGVVDPNNLNKRVLSFNFSDFSGLNFTSVDGVTAIFTSANSGTGNIAGTQFDIGEIVRRDIAVNVPEPTALVMFGSTMALGLFGRRRRRSA